ncbi:MAG: class I SAM-dependent methyltransferase [Acidimicrobiia bacterium]
MNSTGWDERYSGTDLVWTAEPNRFLVEEVADLAPGRALDVACGEGRNAVWLAGRGWQVTGVDFSAVGLDKARQLAESRGVVVEWVTADVTRYEPPTEAFDLVIVLYLHLPSAEIAAALAHATGALAPGGTLLVIGHDASNLTDGYGGPQHPRVLYGPDEIVAALGTLTVERAERVRRPVVTDDGTVDAIDVVVRAHREAS